MNECHSVCRPEMPRRMSSYGFDSFLQINFQDLAAKFAEKKHESFTNLTFHHAQCRLTIPRLLVSCREFMHIASHDNVLKQLGCSRKSVHATVINIQSIY